MPDLAKPAHVESADLEPIRQQLARVLASTHFRNSKRCYSLLEYVVLAACEGRHDSLKERVVGMSVFGRDADYDTNQDAVVRNAAAEVRKRLAQYYSEPGRDTELRIELPTGSYLPAFRPPTATTTARPRVWTIALASLLVVSIAGALIWSRHNTRQTELDQFWAPLVASHGVVQICVGQPAGQYHVPAAPPKQISADPPTLAIPNADLLPMRERFIYFGDSICMSRLAGYLYARGKECRYRSSTSAPYGELRGNPVVLVGLFNNQWTIRLTGEARYRITRPTPGNSFSITDSAKGGEPVWSRERTPHWWESSGDYALVLRVFDPSMERWVVAAGGFQTHGTMMAGDFLSVPEYFREGAKMLPAGWERKNVEFVLQTKVEGGAPGPPQVLAVHVW